MYFPSGDNSFMALNFEFDPARRRPGSARFFTKIHLLHDDQQNLCSFRPVDVVWSRDKSWNPDMGGGARHAGTLEAQAASSDRRYAHNPSLSLF
jgi:hypothetical protein